MTTERIDIVVREDGSRVVRRNLEEIGDGARKGAAGVNYLQDTLRTMKAVVASLGIGVGISELVKYIDKWAELEGRLRLVTNSYSQMQRVQNDLLGVATRTRSALEGTVDLYTRIARSTQTLNVGDKERLRVTEAINKSVVISGTSATSAQAALMQLGQGFASGTLRGEELNSVLEQTPRLAQAIADGMGVTIGQLRAMGAEGKLTSEAVFKAVMSQSDALEKEFGQMPKTIAQSFTLLNNEVLKFVGQGAQANGVAGTFATVLGFVANNLTTLAGLVQGFIAYKLAEFFLGAAAAIYKKVTAMGAEIAAMQAQRAATLAAAQAESAAAAATTARATATIAAIELSRAEAIAGLGQARAAIASAQASIQAATAAGAQSFALRVLAQSEIALTAATAARTAMTSQLALLGQQQARVSAQVAAATVAETAATTALNAARTGATAAGGLAVRALGLLGGPIGVVTTLLGLGATAWALWGNKAVVAETQAEETLAEKTQGVIASLDAQIAKLKERNRLRDINPDLAKSEGAAAEQQKELARQMNLVATGGAGYEGLNQAAKTEILRSLGAQYNELGVKAGVAATELGKANAAARNDNLKAWYAENGTAAQRMAAELEGLRKKFGEIPPEMEKLVRAKYKDPGLKAANKDLKETADLLAGLSGLSGDFHEKWKLLSNAYAKGSLSLKGLTDAQAALLATQPAIREELEKETKIRNEHEKLMKDAESAVENDVNGILSQVEALELKVKTFGMLPAAILDVQIAELQASQQSLVLTDQGVADIQRKIDALNKLRAVQQQLSEKEFAKDATDKLGKELTKVSDTFGESLTDAIMRGFESGKDFMSNFGASLKNMFKTMILQPTIQGIMAPVAGALGGATSGAAGSAGGSAAAGMLGGLFGAGGLAGSVAAGAGWLTGATTLGGSLSAAGSLIGTGTLAGGMSGAGMIVGALGPIALGIGALVLLWKKLDTSGTIHTGGASRADGNGVSNIDAQSLNFARINTASATQEMTSGLASGIVKLLDSTASAFGKTAGYSAATAFADDTSKDGAWGALVIEKLGEKVVDWQDTRTSRWAPKEFANGEAGQAQYLAAMSASVRTALDAIGLPSWAKTMLDGLGSAPSIEDLAKTVDTIGQMQNALKQIGEGIKGFAGISDAAVSAIIKASGGMDALATNATAYFDNFYTESEKMARTTQQVSDALKAVGIAMPATREAYRAEVDAKLALGEAGAPAVAVLLGVASAFAQIVPAAASAADALGNNANAVKLLADKRKMEIRVLELVGKKSEALAMQRNDELAAMDASLRGLQRQINALEDLETAKDSLQEAYDREVDNLTTLRDKFKEVGAGIRQFLDQMVLGNMSNLSPEAKYAEAKFQFDRTYNLAKSGDPEAMARMQQASTDFLTASKDYYASSQQYTTDFEYVRSSLVKTAAHADTQANIAQQEINLMTQMVAGILKVDGSVQTFAQALNAYNAALGVASSVGAPVDQNAALKGQIEALYGNLLGRKSDSEGMKFWLDHAMKGVSMDVIKGGFLGSDEYLKMNRRALGGATPAGLTMVGEYGPEMVNFERPGMVYNASQTSSILGAGSDELAELIEEVRLMREALLVELQAANVQRGAVATVQFNKLDALAESQDNVARAVERA